MEELKIGTEVCFGFGGETIIGKVTSKPFNQEGVFGTKMPTQLVMCRKSGEEYAIQIKHIYPIER